MKNEVTIVGCDLHDRSLLLQRALGMSKPQQKSFANDSTGRGEMVQYLTEFARRHASNRIVFVYEASGQGFGLHDLLTDHGIECHVLSPTHLKKSPKQKKNKTDAKDALYLLEQARAHVLAGNELPIVWTPPPCLRNDRELVRARLETAEAATAVKLQILSLLKRQGRELPQVGRLACKIPAVAQGGSYPVTSRGFARAAQPGHALGDASAGSARAQPPVARTGPAAALSGHLRSPAKTAWRSNLAGKSR